MKSSEQIRVLRLVRTAADGKTFPIIAAGPPLISALAKAMGKESSYLQPAGKAAPPMLIPAKAAVRVTASPYHIDGEPVHPRGPAAYRVGEHTRAVLGDLLGYPPARIAELARSGVIDAP